jgi:hypothetical protein
MLAKDIGQAASAALAALTAVVADPAPHLLRTGT